VTPLVVDGVMYFNAGSKLFASTRRQGRRSGPTRSILLFWRRRGPAYGDGRIYAYGANVLYAIDAKTGQPLQSFGAKGRLLVADAAIKFKYPGEGSRRLQDGVAADLSQRHAVRRIGRLREPYSRRPDCCDRWQDGSSEVVFNTIPQKPTDDGWEITRDSWIGGQRAGGGMWTQPAIDAELGLMYLNAGNPSPTTRARHDEG